MKKVFALVLAVLMTALLAGCGGTQAKTKTNSASPKKNGGVSAKILIFTEVLT